MSISSLLLKTFLLVGLCLLISCKPRTQENEEAAIKQTLIDMWEAIEEEDVERYASFIHPDFSQFGENDTVLKTGKAGEILGVKNWVAYSDNIHTEMEEPLVSIEGNTAWITYYWKDRGMNGKVPFASRGKSTRIFVKEEGKWLCIHGHYTLLPNRKSQLSPAELAIYELREQSNQALLSGQISAISEFWTDDILITTGNGTLLQGKTSIESFLENVYKEIPDVVYERTTAEVKVNIDKGLSWEKGTWIGYKKGAKETAIATGNYAAMWSKVGEEWKMKSQLFVQL